MAIKIEMLKCFVSVAQHGSLSDAAHVLCRTPSAVSMMLKQFEDHIGSPLFETGRKSRLTPLGALIFKEASREINHFENTLVVIDGLSRSELGYLRLAVTPSVAATFLPPLILKFTQKFADIQIDIRDMDSAAIGQELSQERVDIGIGSLAPIEGMTCTELFSDRFGVVCRKDHPLAQNWDQLTWKDMKDHVLIANGLCHLIADPDFQPILARSRLMVPSTISLMGLVRAGVGISVLPRLAVASELDDIAFLPLKDIAARRTVHIVSQPKKQLLPAAREFLSLVKDMKQNDDLFSSQ